MATHLLPLTLVGMSADGNAFVNEVNNDPARRVLPHLDAAADGTLFYQCRVPQNYAGTPKLLVGFMANATTGAARLVVGHVATGDGETMDVAYVDEAAQDLTAPATAYLRDEATFPSAGSLTTTAPAVGDLLDVRVLRDADHLNDTLAVDLVLLGCWLSYSDA